MSLLLLFRPFGGVGPPAPVTPEPTLPAGGGGIRRRQRFSIEVRKKLYVFEDLDELVYFVSRQEVEAEQAAEQQGERDAKRILRLGPARTKIAPPRSQMQSATPEIAEYIAAVDAKLERAYRDALMAALGREAEEIEDILFIARLD